MAGEIPPGVVADGNIRATWVPTLADPESPKKTELDAPAAVDLSCFLTKDGLTRGGDEQTVNDERLCSRQVYEAPGTYTDTLDLTYVYDAQSIDKDKNGAYMTLKHLTEGFVVLRYGLPFEDDNTIGDLLDVIPVTCGVQRKQAPEANSKLKVTQKMHVTGRTRADVALAA